MFWVFVACEFFDGESAHEGWGTGILGNGTNHSINGKDKSKSRFPAGMTDRKAKTRRGLDPWSPTQAETTSTQRAWGTRHQPGFGEACFLPCAVVGFHPVAVGA